MSSIRSADGREVSLWKIYSIAIVMEYFQWTGEVNGSDLLDMLQMIGQLEAA